jgi:hypothetical protein
MGRSGNCANEAPGITAGKDENDIWELSRIFQEKRRKNMKAKNCPRCGKLPQSNEWKFKDQEPVMLYFCANEDCPECLNETLTIERWNQIVYPPEVQEVIEAAQRVVDCQAVFNGVFEAVEKLADKLDALEEMESRYAT